MRYFLYVELELTAVIVLVIALVIGKIEVMTMRLKACIAAFEGAVYVDGRFAIPLML
jgi:hypothetical protein